MQKKQSSSKLLIYGRHSVYAALNNKNRKCKTLYTTKTTIEDIKDDFPHLKIPIQIKDPKELSLMLPVDLNHQNIILEVEPLKQIHIEDVLEETLNKESSCLIILDQVTDPHNIGAIVRSAAAFGIDAVIIPENNSPKENNTIIKTSAGACEIIPIVRVVNIAQCMKTLQKNGYWIIGLDGNTHILLEAKILSQKIVFVLGSEDTGMRKLTKENCDYIAQIPISNNIESLNVSNAAAIAMYEFTKFIK